MKQATRTYNIATGQTLDLGESSTLKIRKIIVSSSAAAGARTITFSGANIYDYLSSTSANYIGVPETFVAGWYERKTSYNDGTITVRSAQNSTVEIDFSGSKVHRVVAPADTTIIAIVS
jgi:hypothetical protein